MVIKQSKIGELLNKTIFFSCEKGEIIENYKYLESIPLSAIPFTIRFMNIIKMTSLFSIRDLLNSNSNDLLRIRNCGTKSISDAKKNIFHFLSELFDDNNFNLIYNYPIEKKVVPQKVVYIPLLEQTIINPSVSFLKLKKIKLSKINFPTRLRNYLISRPDLKTVGDILNLEVNKLIKNKKIGRKSITETKTIINNLISNEKEIQLLLGAKNHILYIVEELLDRTDGRTKIIFNMRWGENGICSLEEIGGQLNLTRERVRQIIRSNLRNIHNRLANNRDFYLEYFLNIITETASSIRYDQLECNLFDQRKYPKNMLMGVLSELFFEVPFNGYCIKGFPQYLLRNTPQKNRFTYFYYELKKIDLPFRQVFTPDLYEKMKIRTIKDKLILLYTIINSNEYRFCNDKSSFFLIRKGNLHQITKDILQGSNEPKSIQEIIDTIDKHYENKYLSISSVLGNLKLCKDFFQLDRFIFGLEKHFGYPKSDWQKICLIVKSYILEIRRQTNAAELFEILIVDYPKIRSKYELVYIIRNDQEIIDLGFFNYSLRMFGEEERLKIVDAIKALFEEEPNPKNISEIYKIISEQRFLRMGGMGSVLKSQPYLESYKVGFFGLKSLHDQNIRQLAKNEMYIEKIITYECFPETTLTNINLILSPSIHGEIIKTTVSESETLHLLEDLENGFFFVISKRWSLLRVIRCILFNFSREVYWEELSWILNDIGLKLQNDEKYKIFNDKCIICQGNKLKYFDSKIDHDDAQDIADICYEILSQKKELILVENLCDNINNDFAEITNSELIYILENDERFVIVDEQLIMVQ